MRNVKTKLRKSPKVKNVKKPKKNVQSLDEFMSTGFDDNSDNEESSTIHIKKQKLGTRELHDKEVDDDDDESVIDFESDSDNEGTSKVESEEEDEDEDEDALDPKKFKKSMNSLQRKDPEFYKYLSENDANLLNFEVSDDESISPETEENLHKPDGKLQVASDDSDFSEDEGDNVNLGKGRVKVTSTLISSWTNTLEETPNVETIRSVIQAFHSACEQASDSKSSSSKYVVEGNTAFNGIVRLCLVGLIPAMHKVLKLPPPTMPKSDKQGMDPSKSKQWSKILVPLKTYLSDVVKMMSVVSESEIVTLLLRHVLYLIPFFLQFLKHARLLLKKLVNFWCTSEESVRVLSFLGIIRLVRTMPKEYLDYILKQMYLAYVKNCKFTSPTTWPLINFMKRSLVELYCLDHNVAYQQAFIYIRQLAIHLRNATTTKTKDSLQTVYNWQYVHCILLWSHLLSESRKSDVTKPLIYPLVQIALGTIRLIPTSKFFPLRFHIVRSLTKLSQETGTFISVLPLILEVLSSITVGKKSSSLSMKPLNFSCVLKVSKSQQRENGFKDACIEHFFELFMDYANVYSHTVGFPELVLPASVQMKNFLKKCKVANYCKEIKRILEKLDENSKYIFNRRKAITISLSDFEKVYEWERNCKESGTPLNKFYVSWRELKDRNMLRSIATNENDNDEEEFEKHKDEKRPIKKRKHIANPEEREEFKELFVKDDDDSDNSSLFGE